MISDKKEQVYDILKAERRAVSLQELMFLTGVDRYYISRYITGLIKEKRITRFYMALSEEEGLSNSNSGTSHLKKDTNAWRVYDALRKANREVSQNELEEITGLRLDTFRVGLERYLKRGLFIKRKLGLENYFHIPGIKISEKTLEQTFNREMFVNQIDPLRAFIEYLKFSNKCSPEVILGYTRNIIFFYKFKSGLNLSQFTVYPSESFKKQDIDDFIAYCNSQHYSCYRLRQLLVTLRTYFKFLYRQGLISENLREAILLLKNPNNQPKRIIEILCPKDKIMKDRRECRKRKCKYYIRKYQDNERRAKCHFDESSPENYS
jgi:hypothetical protein